MNDIIAIFKEHFAEEIRDSNKYMDLAFEAKNKDNYLCKELFLMARDEYTHAKCIKETLCKYNVEIPDEQMDLWERLECRVKYIY